MNMRERTWLVIFTLWTLAVMVSNHYRISALHTRVVSAETRLDAIEAGTNEW